MTEIRRDNKIANSLVTITTFGAHANNLPSGFCTPMHTRDPTRPLPYCNFSISFMLIRTPSVTRLNKTNMNFMDPW